MDNQVHNQIVSFIWGIADDCLRDVYVRGKYRDVILPMTVIRRLDAMLEETKPAVLAMKKQLDAAKIDNQWPALCNAAGQAFCNASPFLLKDLTSRSKAQTLKADFKANAHKIWAQEIVILLNELYPEDTLIKLYAGDVFSSIGNHKGIEHINSEYQDITALERFFSEFRDDYLTIPAEPDEKFFAAQKTAYDHLTDDCFSYSAPTSMGKSFIMRMFIKNEVIHGAQKNYALIVPTKALINEVRGKVIDDLGENGNLEKINYLDRCNYRVVTAASDIALEEEHNYIFVLTPERLLYLLISQPKVQIDYLFIDEAHKLSGKNSRAPFYYKVVDMLLKREPKPHFIFASPNIPNPQVYLRMMTDIEAGDDSKLAITYSPVVQVIRK